MALISAINENEFAAYPPLYAWVSAQGSGADVMAQLQQGIECVLVGDPRLLVGIVTPTDMLRAIAGGQDPSSLPVQAFMQVAVPTIPWEQRTNFSLIRACFQHHRVQYLPVMAADGAVLTVLTPADLLTLQENTPTASVQLPDLPDAVPPWPNAYQQAVDRSPNAIFFVDPAGKILLWNAACQALLDYGPEIAGQDLWTLLAEPADRAAIAPHIARAMETQGVSEINLTYRRKNGSLRHTLSRIYGIFDNQERAIACVFANTDITQLKQTEDQLRQREQSLARTQKLAQIGDWTLDLTTWTLTASEETLRILGLPPEPTTLPFEGLLQRVHPQDHVLLQTWFREAIHYPAPYNLEFRLLLPDGSLVYAVMNGQVVQGSSQEASYLFGTLQDISVRKAIETLQQNQAHRHEVMLHVTQRIRQSLALDNILQATVAEVRDLFQVDRVMVYRFEADWSGVFRVEAVRHPQYSVLAQTVDDPCFRKEYVERYEQGRYSIIEDVDTEAIAPCHRELLKQFNVRANLVVPILARERLWGLLIVHQCEMPRHWQTWEQEFLQQLGIQVGIAVQQSELYEWVQQLNVELETIVQQRTERLQQASAFEVLLKGITDKVRDSLDEQQILQKVVRELTIELKINSCDTSVYNLERQTSTIQYEFLAEGGTSARSRTIYIQDFPEIYAQLMAGKTVHFCWQAPNTGTSAAIRLIQEHYTVLACPLMDSQVPMGDLWLYRAGEEPFDELEVRLVEQIANQCAIAIRQARLYEAAQAQVKDLAHLNRLKDEFLSSVSHELRTPMANVKMATEMLEVKLMEMGLLREEQHTSFLRYFQILKDECHRELKLINDLLDLSRLDAESEPLLFYTMELQDWLHHLAEPFLARTRAKQQTLEIYVPEDLPPLTCDFMYLGRIVGELLNNACKYTPEGGEIQVVVHPRSEFLQIHVHNSGIEIAVEEQERIFERFYRIPTNDPWQHEGTGLGLALVQKLAERLGGTVTVDSRNNWTTFTLYLFPKMLLAQAEAENLGAG